MALIFKKLNHFNVYSSSRAFYQSCCESACFASANRIPLNIIWPLPVQIPFALLFRKRKQLTPLCLTIDPNITEPTSTRTVHLERFLPAYKVFVEATRVSPSSEHGFYAMTKTPQAGQYLQRRSGIFAAPLRCSQSQTRSGWKMAVYTIDVYVEFSSCEAGAVWCWEYMGGGMRRLCV